MKKLLALVAPMLGLLPVLGCANKDGPSEPSTVNESVTNVDGAPLPLRDPEPTYTAPFDAASAIPAAAPLADETPVMTETPSAPAPGTLTGTYTVKKGDTLFSIARQRYGSGGQWQRIASANPGLTPATLKAGTTIGIP